MPQLAAISGDRVELLPGHWQRQHDQAVDAYLAIPNDDILHGIRRHGGLPSAGKSLSGWCRVDSSVVLGQWLSALSVFARSTGRPEIREKVVALTDQWAETLPATGFGYLNNRFSPGGHYAYDKLVGGLVDVGLAGHDPAFDYLSDLTALASTHLDRVNVPASPEPSLHSGRAPEWYTLSENLYRAALATGDSSYREFADVWNYDHYWDKFADTARPDNAWGVHAYSHLNTFSGAAARHLTDGDERSLAISRNAHDFFIETQTFATGGFGPAERIQPYGHLGRSLDTRMDSFETPCGSWAAFKLSKYLLEATGEARFGEWIERLFYNGIGAALPMESTGSHFYYADYRVSGGVKTVARDHFCCCSGTYAQAVAAYPELIFFADRDDLFVNLFTPARVAHTVAGQTVEVVVHTDFPIEEHVRVSVQSPTPARFKLALRIPEYGSVEDLRVDGAPVAGVVDAGWLIVDRVWEGGAEVTFTLPLEWRAESISDAHPDRIALLRGPAVYVLDAWRHEPLPGDPTPTLRTDATLESGAAFAGFALAAETGVGAFDALVHPFYQVPADWTYRMYFDRASRPYAFY
jgi:hypothetical protein